MVTIVQCGQPRFITKKNNLYIIVSNKKLFQTRWDALKQN